MKSGGNQNHEISQLCRVQAFLCPRIRTEVESVELSSKCPTQAGRLHQKDHLQRFKST